MRRLLTHALLILCVLLVALFAFSNRAFVSLGLFPLPYELEMPLFVLIPVIFLLGFALGVFSSLPGRIVSRKRWKQEQRNADELEKEVQRLRLDNSTSRDIVAQ